MKSYEDMKYFDLSEKLVDVLCNKTQNTDRHFFRILVGYAFSKVASMMRVDINTRDRGRIPVNMYAINLATSGHGKGFSTNIIEEDIINQFRERFLHETFALKAEENINAIGAKRALQAEVESEEDEIRRVRKEFKDLGEMVFSFDSGTTAAVKQMRYKLLMANAGSINMEIDEIGSNLLGNVDVLSTMLELYDVGKVKQKLTKNTSENTRGADLDGRTPTNCMLYGTPSKLLNGAKEESEFIAMLEAGYARRCFFGYSRASQKDTKLSVDQVYNMMVDKSSSTLLQQLSNDLGQLADINNWGISVEVSEKVTKLLIMYKLTCERIAEELPEFLEVQKAELSHRYFKALKLAGAYAFIAQEPEITEEILYNAIKLTEDSGKHFQQMMQRERNFVKLARYLASVDKDSTIPELVEDLPFFKGSQAVRKEMLDYAISWGYKHNIIIKRIYVDGIEFLRGETLEETDLNKMSFSMSKDLAQNYKATAQPWDKLYKLTQDPGRNFCTHSFKNFHRTNDNAIPGSNLVVLDIDGTATIDLVKLLLKDYKYLIYTTQSHLVKCKKNPDGKQERFRLIMPLSHKVKLDNEDFTQFMKNIFAWLPFEVDEGTTDMARKWAAHKGHYEYNDGCLLDVHQFIPKTKKAEEISARNNELSNLDNLERWFMQNTGAGNRSNNLIRYAFMLVDSGRSYDDVLSRVNSLNSKLAEPLSPDEILSTIGQTVAKRISSK